MRGQRGLNQVITTLILLVVTVLLAGVVTYYATNIAKVRTENEELLLSKAHVWVNSTGAVAAFKLQNLGGRDVLLDKITVRGIESSWSSVWYYRVPLGTSITGDMNITSYDNLSGSPTIGGKQYSMASDDIPLQSSGELLVYVKGPDDIQMDDLGTTVSMGIFTNNAQYVTQVNVKSATSQ